MTASGSPGILHFSCCIENMLVCPRHTSTRPESALLTSRISSEVQYPLRLASETAIPALRSPSRVRSKYLTRRSGLYCEAGAGLHSFRRLDIASIPLQDQRWGSRSSEERTSNTRWIWIRLMIQIPCGANS
jgi:hypothetical protein